MTIVKDSSSNLTDTARGYYDAGNYERVLELIGRSDASDIDPTLLAYAANANLKLGRLEAAADQFVAMGGRVPTQRSFALKAASTLYLKAGQMEKLAAVAAAAIAASPSDAAFAFSVLRAVQTALPTEELEPLLDHLDRKNGEHVYFIVNFYRDHRKDFARAYAEIVKGVEACPNDGFLMVQRYSLARVACDFPVLRAFDRLMAAPRTGVGEQVFLNQTALDRLYWCDDEKAQTVPTMSSQRLAANAKALGPRIRRKITNAPRPLRIGYISNDFGNEVVMAVFRGVLERHDPRAVDVRLFCYSRPEVRQFQQKWPQQLRAAVVPIADLSDQQAAEAISAAEIDILVDLKGHTKGERLSIMRLTDAPLTATYLGYPGSVFGAGGDYLIADCTVTPDTSRSFYAEKLCRLPEVQMPNDTLALNATRSSRSDWGLPGDRFVFASFNGQQKITPRTIDLWSRILHETPDAVLWLACGEALAAENLLTEFARLGIGPGRIIFNGKAPRFADHIGRLALADLALDTLPYNGHSTTADMLRGGLPVLTVRGQCYHSRVSWSLLNSCGIEELAAASDEDYCRMAVELMHDPSRLAELRTRLWTNRMASPLFNPERMARHLERAYQMMAERARNGLPPEHLDVPALPAIA